MGWKGCAATGGVLVSFLLYGCATPSDSMAPGIRPVVSPPHLNVELQIRDAIAVVGGLVPLRVIVHNRGGTAADDLRMALAVTPHARILGGRGDSPAWLQDVTLIFDEPAPIAPRAYAEWWVVIEPRAEGSAGIELTISDAGDGVPLRARTELAIIAAARPVDRQHAQDLFDAVRVNSEFDREGAVARLRSAALLHDDPDFRARVYFELAESLRALGRVGDAHFTYQLVRVLAAHTRRGRDEQWPDILRQLPARIAQTRLRDIDGIPVAPLPATGTITGVVSAGTGRERIAGATITLDGDAHASARTDERGEFELTGVIPDRYMLLIEKPGYAPVTVGVFARTYGTLHVGVPLAPVESAAEAAQIVDAIAAE